MEKSEKYFAVIKTRGGENSGAYEVREYLSLEEFEKMKKDTRELIIEQGISEEEAKKIALEYNDRHIIPKNIEKILGKFR